jgi:hypothetical protein
MPPPAIAPPNPPVQRPKSSKAMPSPDISHYVAAVDRFGR